MSVIVMQADSTSLVLNGTAITDFIEGDFLTLTFANPLTAHVNAASNGVNINKRNDGNVCDLAISVQKFSPADVFLTSAANQAAVTVFNGSVKEDVTRDGADFSETYTLENGSFTVQPVNAKNNTDGNAAMDYTIRFRNAQRAI